MRWGNIPYREVVLNRIPHNSSLNLLSRFRDFSSVPVVGLPSLLTDSMLAFDVADTGASLEVEVVGLVGLADSIVCDLARCTFFLPTASNDEGGDSAVGDAGGDVIFLILSVRVRRRGIVFIFSSFRFRIEVMESMVDVQK
jgi:hypothetical protein